MIMRHHQLTTLIIVVILGLGVSGFAAPGVSAQNLFGDLLTGFEVMIGQSVAEDVYEQYGQPVRLIPSQQTWVDAIFSDLTAKAGRKEITYSLTILDSEIVNAFAAPGGYLFVTTGLLAHIGGDTDALANVLGHEIAHVEHKHGINTLLRRFGIGLLLQLALGGNTEDNQVWQTVAGVATELMHLGWSREQEYESDELGQKLAAAAGYDPHGMVRFFEVLQGLQGEEIAFLELLSTHPLTSERADRARARARNLAIAPRSDSSPRTFERSAESIQVESSDQQKRASESTGQIDSPSAADQNGSGVGRVISRRGTASPVLGHVFHDPAGRFKLQLPPGWQTDPTFYYEGVEFGGPDDALIWVYLHIPEPHETTPQVVARGTIDHYKSIFSDLVVLLDPHEARLMNVPAYYTEFQYTDHRGVLVREGSYSLLHSGLVVLFQFAAPISEFDRQRATFHTVAESLQLGEDPIGLVDATILSEWPTTELFIDDQFVMDISQLWPMTWKRPDTADSLSDPQLYELVEIGDLGYMAVFEFDVARGTSAVDTAHEWVDFLQQAADGFRIIQPVWSRRIGRLQAASFIAKLEDQAGTWTQYATTIVVDRKSYEIAILYEENGFNARRHVFDQWLMSFRPM